MREPRVRVGATFDDVADFTDAWRKLETLGACDAFGSMQYRRLLPLWIRSGKPRPPCVFIRQHANAPSPVRKEST